MTKTGFDVKIIPVWFRILFLSLLWIRQPLVNEKGDCQGSTEFWAHQIWSFSLGSSSVFCFWGPLRTEVISHLPFIFHSPVGSQEQSFFRETINTSYAIWFLDSRNEMKAFNLMVQKGRRLSLSSCRQKRWHGLVSPFFLWAIYLHLVNWA